MCRLPSPSRVVRVALLLCALNPSPSTIAQSYPITNWVNNPFSPNTNFTVIAGNSTSPTFMNNGVDRGTLYGHSPIGATLALNQPGDTITVAGQVRLSGDINPDGNLQFRVGLLSRGDNTGDTNWLGYLLGNPTGVGGDAGAGLYIRNNPNPGIYASGSPGNAMRPKASGVTYKPGWAAGTYDFQLSVSLIAPSVQHVSWKLAEAGGYHYSGQYTNSFALTVPAAFDHVGFMGGAGLFRSASTNARLSFTNVAVVFRKPNVTR